MTQREAVLAALRAAGAAGICLDDLPRGLGYTLRNRISELRAAGVPIRDETCRVHPHRSGVRRYVLATAEQMSLPGTAA